MIHQSLQPPAEEPVEKPALQEECLEVRMTVRAGLCALPDFEDIQQHQQVQDADDPQE